MWISRWLVWCDWYAPCETVKAYCKRQSRANRWKCAEAASVVLPHLLSHRDRVSSQKAGSAWFSETIRRVHTAAESPSYASVGVWSTGGTHGCWPLCVSQGCKKEIILCLLWMPNGCLRITIWHFHVNNCLMLHRKWCFSCFWHRQQCWEETTGWQSHLQKFHQGKTPGKIDVWVMATPSDFHLICGKWSASLPHQRAPKHWWRHLNQKGQKHRRNVLFSGWSKNTKQILCQSIFALPKKTTFYCKLPGCGRSDSQTCYDDAALLFPWHSSCSHRHQITHRAAAHVWEAQTANQQDATICMQNYSARYSERREGKAGARCLKSAAGFGEGGGGL